MPTAAYVGTTANLLPLEWVTSVRKTQAGRYSIQESASRSWAFVNNSDGRTPDRTWEVAAIGSVATLANLEALASGAWGDGPFHWIPEDAYVTNAVTPAQSGLLTAPGGPVAVVNGHAPRSALGPSQSILAAGVPVLPSQPVVVACDAAGAATLTATFRNANGASVGVFTQPSVGSTMQRIHIARPLAPATARTVDVAVSGHVAAARPQVTWTRSLMPWGPGMGASSVVVEDLDATPRHMDGNRGLLYDIAVTLREVS